MGMTKHITIIEGHPDSNKVHFCHVLTDAYVKGAEEAGHRVKRLSVAELDLPLLRSKEEWETDTPSLPIQKSQEAIAWADHLIIIYPLWLGTMPALLKAFFEQVFRPGFAINKQETGKMWKKLLSGKSARIIITMGMPALFYRWYFRAHSLKSLERNILAFTGIGPINSSLIGLVENMDDNKRKKWMDKMYKLGQRAA
jgi:putative NADPH-quinone reductase